MIVKVRVKLVFGWKLKVIHNYNDSHISEGSHPYLHQKLLLRVAHQHQPRYMINKLNSLILLN